MTDPTTADPPAAPHDPAEAFSVRTGVVTSFDDHVGAGTLADDATGRTWWFHCTSIAGGSRTVPLGVPVSFRAEPGPTGLEAVAVTAASPT